MTNLFRLASLAALLISSSAFAVEFYPEITSRDADFTYYSKAAQIDREYVANHLIEAAYYNYSSDFFFKKLPNTTPVGGRLVQLLDGPRLNPRNVVLTVNGKLFFVRTELSEFHSRVSMARRWNDNDGEPPGIYVIVRGYRAGELPGQRIPLTIDLRVSDTNGKALEYIEYYEDAGRF